MKTRTAALTIALAAIGHAHGQMGRLPDLPKWATEPWKATPPAYARAAKRVAAEIEASKDPVGLVNRYRKEAASGPTALDPMAAFRWGTAWLLVRDRRPELRSQRPYLEQALTRLPFPGNVAYARVCFLVYDWGIGDRRAEPIAERLLKAFPDDLRVVYSSAMVYGVFGTDQESERFLELAQDLVRRAPGEGKGYSLLGYYYFDRWVRKHDRSAIAKALEFNGKALDRGPVDEADRRRLVRMIGQLQKASR